MRIAVASSSRLALAIIEAIEGAGHELCGVITMPDAPKGRGRELSASELASCLNDRAVAKPGSAEELERAIRVMAPELIITIAYGRLIKEPALSLPTFGWLNVHFSLLPKYRGAAPVQRALIAGETETGVTIFKLELGMDTGPIYSQSKVRLQGNETAGELLESLNQLGARDLITSIKMIEAGQSPTVQTGSPSFAPKIAKAETRIDWHESAIQIERKIRAFQPEPGAWSTFRGQRTTISAAQRVEGEGAPGEILTPDPLVIATGSGAIEIKNLQSGGRRELSASEWVRGARIIASDRFE